MSNKSNDKLSLFVKNFKFDEPKGGTKTDNINSKPLFVSVNLSKPDRTKTKEIIQKQVDEL